MFLLRFTLVALLALSACSDSSKKSKTDVNNNPCGECDADMDSESDGPKTYTCNDFDFRATGAECSAGGCPSMSCACSGEQFPVSLTSCSSDGCLVSVDCDVFCQEGVERAFDCDDVYSIGVDPPDPTDFDGFCAAQFDIPESECLALAEIYKGRRVRTWFAEDEPSICEWSSLECADGHIVRIYPTDLNLEGTIPDVFDAFPNLTYLAFTGPLSGSIPASVYRLTELETLGLRDTLLEGGISPEIANLSKLQSLTIEDAPIGGTLPPEIASCTALRLINLKGLGLTGTIPDLSALSELVELRVPTNMFTGPLPSHIGNLTNLEELYVGTNQMSGALPDLTSLSKLVVFSAASNQFTDATGALAGLPNLTTIDLGSNQLTNFPDEWAALPAIEWIAVRQNQISVIPDAISTRVTLSLLDVARNQVTALPANLGNLQNLFHFNVESNEIGGPLPSYDWPNIQHLILNNNRFTGTVSRELASLPRLQSLTLEYNQLEGVLPAELAASAIRTFRTRNNGCLTAENAATATWLAQQDVTWDCGCTMTCP